MTAVERLRQFTAQALDSRTLVILGEQVVEHRQLYSNMLRDLEDIPAERERFVRDWADDVREWDWALQTINDELKRRGGALKDT
jgi:hypothetical protein